MDKQQILQADVLDIIFEQRNKLYGAYELRRNYNRRVKKAFVISASFVTLFLTVPFLLTLCSNDVIAAPKPVITELKVIDLPDEPDKIEEIKPVDPPAQPDLPTEQFTNPQIIHAVDVVPEDTPPSQDDLQTAYSGTEDHTTDNPGTLNVPVTDPGTGTGIATHVDVNVEPEKIWEQEDISEFPEFPGGDPALERYLKENLSYPDQAADDQIEGRVVVSFVVDKNGNIDNLEVVRGLGHGLDDEALKTVDKMPKWKPGKMNGKPVNVKFTLPVNFRIQ